MKFYLIRFNVKIINIEFLLCMIKILKIKLVH